jgi:bifunctional DNA-binding transcriptional regulator/antitoxin component of YhaV-PrlF toxin-antitoxin module
VGKAYLKGMTHALLMSPEASFDGRGRITIRKEYREVLGDDVVQVLTPRGVLLRPRAKRVRNIHRLPAAERLSGEDAALRDAP